MSGCTFVVVFGLLQVSQSEAGLGEAPVVSNTPALAPLQAATDSVAPGILGDHVAVGVPIAGSELLLRDLKPGDHLDLLASLPAGQGARAVTAVVVSGATVLRPAAGGDPLLLDVPTADASVLAHLVLGGGHLGYTVWPPGAASVATAPPLAEPTARALLGLPVNPDQRP